MIRHHLLSLVAVAVMAASAFGQEDPALDKLLTAVHTAKESQAKALAEGQQSWKTLALDYQTKQAGAQLANDQLRATSKAIEDAGNERAKLLADPALLSNPVKLGAAINMLRSQVDALNEKALEQQAAALLAAAESDVAHSTLDEARAKFDALQNQRCVPCDEVADYVATQAAKKQLPPEASIVKQPLEQPPGAPEGSGHR